MTTATATSPRVVALAAARRWRLPFARQAWRGYAGNWAGVGAGSSLDFQDHRHYLPGDDPRHIHWQAFARTGTLTMKLYRAEVAPAVDVAVDISASMTLAPEKTARVDELVAFCVDSADRAAAPVRLHAVLGRTVRAIATEEVRAGRWRERLATTSPAGNAGASQASHASDAVGPVPWRRSALRVLISDLLFPGDPATVLVPLAGTTGVGIVLAPALSAETELVPRGNVELTDCETGSVRRQRIDDALAARYHDAYQRHFALWREASRKRGVLFARVGCDGDLAHALAGEAAGAGAVESIE